MPTHVALGPQLTPPRLLKHCLRSVTPALFAFDHHFAFAFSRFSHARLQYPEQNRVCVTTVRQLSQTRTCRIPARVWICT